jgi:hypothetical protein
MKQDMDLIAKSQVKTFVNHHEKKFQQWQNGFTKQMRYQVQILTFLKHLVTKGLKKRVTSTTTGGMANVQKGLSKIKS